MKKTLKVAYSDITSYRIIQQEIKYKYFYSCTKHMSVCKCVKYLPH